MISRRTVGPAVRSNHSSGQLAVGVPRCRSGAEAPACRPGAPPNQTVSRSSKVAGNPFLAANHHPPASKGFQAQGCSKQRIPIEHTSACLLVFSPIRLASTSLLGRFYESLQSTDITNSSSAGLPSPAGSARWSTLLNLFGKTSEHLPRSSACPMLDGKSSRKTRQAIMPDRLFRALGSRAQATAQVADPEAILRGLRHPLPVRCQ